jgi:uncharacterized damage-inducible protein DinB
MPAKTAAKKSAKKPAKLAAKKPAKQVAKPASKPAAKVAAKPASLKPASKPAAAATPALTTECQQRSLANMKAFFERTMAVLDEGDSAFTPMPGMFSAAQQVAHTAQTIDWFLEGAFSPQGFNMDFPALEAEVRKVTSLAAAKKWLGEAYGRFESALKGRPAARWHEPIVKDTIMAGAPRWSVVDGLVDHTAHHRGSLAIYARLRGKTPAMPYM